MIIEDDEDIRLVAHHLMQALGGFEVEACENGSIALDRVAQFEPDMILCDVMMPVMDGLSTLAELKRTPAHAHIPVIFMSARVQKHEIEEYLGRGAVAVIDKPFDPVALSDRIRAIWAEL
ncbi:MAG: response regulator [Rhodothermales bacterium]